MFSTVPVDLWVKHSMPWKLFAIAEAQVALKKANTIKSK